MFLSAVLLFLVQPMFAMMVLPLLGGSPAVWNTTVVFYQVALLAGYFYAHVARIWLRPRVQFVLHCLLVLLPLFVLPIGIAPGWIPPTETNPIPWLLALMLVSVGLPFFVVSTSSPLLQAWFARTRHRTAADPYFLYVASSAGSLLALLAYPFLVQPKLSLTTQSRVWAIGYQLFVVLIFVCAGALWWSKKRQAIDQQELGGDSTAASELQETTYDDAPPLTITRRVRWVLLAFAPSSLMLSVTMYLSTSIAPIPLLWVVPLALYLLTFIIAFARRPLLPHWVIVRIFPSVLLLLVVIFYLSEIQLVKTFIVIHLMAYFVVALACHGTLAQDRPSALHLTEFYLWLAVGGALGGLINSLLAPLLFSSVAEYPTVLVLACALLWRPNKEDPLRERWLDLGTPIAFGSLLILGSLIIKATNLLTNSFVLSVVLGAPPVICFSFSRRALRFALGVAALFFVYSHLLVNVNGQVLVSERSFFGIVQVAADTRGQYHGLMHGSIVHGLQSLAPARRREPLSYFSTSGPIGQVFSAFKDDAAKLHIAVVGLGAGSLACYSRPGQEWIFYEINPFIVQIARDQHYFTFLEDCAPQATIVLGDARLSLMKAPEKHYDIIILDAYTADAIPVHLLTREALKLYEAKLAPHGVLAFHISNRFFNLRPVLGNLAWDLSLTAWGQSHTPTAEEKEHGKTPSAWIILARAPEDLAPLSQDTRWQPLEHSPDLPVWTDEYSSVLDALK